MKGFTSVLVGLALAILIIAIGNFGFHIPDGGGRGLLVAAAAIVFFVFAFGPGRLWGKSEPTYADEVSATKDLKVGLYPGKWKVAKGRVSEREPLLSGTAYWVAVRTMYQELGGE